MPTHAVSSNSTMVWRGVCPIMVDRVARNGGQAKHVRSDSHRTNQGDRRLPAKRTGEFLSLPRVPHRKRRSSASGQNSSLRAYQADTHRAPLTYIYRSKTMKCPSERFSSFAKKIAECRRSRASVAVALISVPVGTKSLKCRPNAQP
jgi:hypothetical protein